jgi:ATPase subunit of ABC transporter with duplicated ATPase domains
LPLLQGRRVENQSLRLGIFTQDLAQELDTSRREVDLVTEYARTGVDGYIHISDRQARNVLGGLALTGDKALRLVGQLSGGEKARVALAMFALKPSNLYLLDEISNHLDIEWYVNCVMTVVVVPSVIISFMPCFFLIIYIVVYILQRGSLERITFGMGR